MRLKEKCFWRTDLCIHLCNLSKQSWLRDPLWIMTSDTFWDPQKFKLGVCVLCWSLFLSQLHMGGVLPCRAASPWPLRRLFLLFGELQAQRENCDFYHSRSKHWHQMTGSCFSLKCCRQHIMGKDMYVKLTFTVRSSKGGNISAHLVMHKMLWRAFWGDGDQVL